MVATLVFADAYLNKDNQRACRVQLQCESRPGNLGGHEVVEYRIEATLLDKLIQAGGVGKVFDFDVEERALGKSGFVSRRVLAVFPVVKRQAL